MKRLLAVVPVAALVLAGCGDTCSSNPATVRTTGGCSTISANQPVINLSTCSACTDTAPTCSVDLAEIGSNQIHLDSVVQQCQSNASCGAGCTFSNTVACNLGVSLTPGTQYTVFYNTDSGIGQTSVTASSGGSASCTL